MYKNQIFVRKTYRRLCSESNIAWRFEDHNRAVNMDDGCRWDRPQFDAEGVRLRCNDISMLVLVACTRKVK